jgi:hypothetical protein
MRIGGRTALKIGWVGGTGVDGVEEGRICRLLDWWVSLGSFGEPLDRPPASPPPSPPQPASFSSSAHSFFQLLPAACFTPLPPTIPIYSSAEAVPSQLLSTWFSPSTAFTQSTAPTHHPQLN